MKINYEHGHVGADNSEGIIRNGSTQVSRDILLCNI